MFRNNIAKEVNIIDVIAIFIILLIATAFQFIFNELPCPLCLLQRVGLLLISIGFLMNLRFGVKPPHYAISIIAALFTASVAFRQILSHITPGSGGYGKPFLGLHLYTWVFIVAIAYILWIAICLLFSRPLKKRHLRSAPWLKVLIRVVFFLVLIVCGINIITSYLECGFAQCPENPVTYKILDSVAFSMNLV